MTLSRRHLVLSFDGARLLATRIGVNPVRLHRKDARGAPVHVRIERDTTEPVFPEDVIEASPGICFRVRDARARFARAPEAALARGGDFDVEKRWPSPEKRWPSPEKWLPSPSPSRAPSSSRSRAVSGARPRRAARGRRETRGGGRAGKPERRENEEAKDAFHAVSDADDDAADAGLDFGGIVERVDTLLCLRGEEMFAVRPEMEWRVAATTWAREVKENLGADSKATDARPLLRRRRESFRFELDRLDGYRRGRSATDEPTRCESNGGVFETVAPQPRLGRGF